MKRFTQHRFTSNSRKFCFRRRAEVAGVLEGLTLAIGDFVDLIRYDPTDFVSLRWRMDLSEQSDMSADVLWNKNNLHPERIDGTEGKSISLKNLVENTPSLQLEYNGGDAMDTMATPFCQLIILTGFAHSGYSESVERTLVEKFSREYSAYIDPELGLNAALIQGAQVSQDEAWLYMGYGIFVPPRDMNAIGCIAIVDEGNNGAVSIPTLPDGRAAAFFPGQRGVAFSHDESLTPATVTGLPRGNSFYLGRFPWATLGKNRNAFDLTVKQVTPDADNVIVTPVNPNEDLGEWDGCFEIETNNHLSHRLYYCADGRQSRHFSQPPADSSYFEVLGVCIKPFLDRPVKKWWVESQANRTLKGSVVHISRSAHVMAGDSVQNFDYGAMAFRRNQRAPALVAGKELCPWITLERATYFRSPHSGQTITFDAFDSVLSGNIDGYDSLFPLDWLDQACKVEYRDEVIDGLASAFDAKMRYDVGSSQDGLMTITATNGVAFVRSDENMPDGTAQYIQQQKFVLHDQMELLLGALVLRYHEL